MGVGVREVRLLNSFLSETLKMRAALRLGEERRGGVEERSCGKSRSDN